MSYKTSIQLKSLFLVIVFSINTIIGFACAIGVDMSFNTSHHAEPDVPPSSAHSHEHGHNNSDGHHDNLGKAGHHTTHQNEVAGAHNNLSNESDCCSDDIAKLLQEEKNLAKSQTIDHPVFEYFYPAPFYYAENSIHNCLKRHTRYFVRNYHPPIPDIRIAIQSFQI